MPLCEEKILIVKKVALVYGCGPGTHDRCKCSAPINGLHSQRRATARVGTFMAAMVHLLAKGSVLAQCMTPDRDETGLQCQCDRQLITSVSASARRRIVPKPFDSSSHFTPWTGTVTFGEWLRRRREGRPARRGRSCGYRRSRRRPSGTDPGSQPHPARTCTRATSRS